MEKCVFFQKSLVSDVSMLAWPTRAGYKSQVAELVSLTSAELVSNVSIDTSRTWLTWLIQRLHRAPGERLTCDVSWRTSSCAIYASCCIWQLFWVRSFPSAAPDDGGVLLGLYPRK